MKICWPLPPAIIRKAFLTATAAPAYSTAVAYLPELEGSRDTCILQAGGTEGIYVAELKLEQLRRYRETEALGNAYRHPKKYGLLTETDIRPPFVRGDYPGE